MTVEDWIEIGTLCAKYNHLVDDNKFGEWAETFVEDGWFEVVGLGEFQGRETIAGVMGQFGYGTLHLCTDREVEINGTTATQSATLVLSKRTPDKGEFKVLTTGRYTDSLVKTATGWRFSRRKIELDIDMGQVVAAFTPAVAAPELASV